jgi:hypothetical protein
MKLYLGHTVTVGALALGAFLAATVVGSAGRAAAAPLPTPSFDGYFYDFEQSLKPWIGVSNTPASAGSTLLQMSGANQCSEKGTSYAGVRTMADAAHKGGAWMLARLNDNHATSVALTWSAKAMGSCRITGAPCAVEAYVGRVAPTQIEQFEPVGPAFFEWSTHSYRADLPLSSSWSRDFYVAIGVRPVGVGLTDPAPTTSSIGLGGYTIGVDCVQVGLESGAPAIR